MKKVTKKLVKKVAKKDKVDMLYVAGLITKGKDKGKYVALEVRNTALLNPVEPIFELHKGMEFVIVGRTEKVVREVFGGLVTKSLK